MEESARPAVLSDLEVLSSLAVAARRELQDKKGGDVADRLDPHRDDPSARMAAALEDPGTVVLAGALDEAVVGYGLMVVGTAPDGTGHAVVEEVYVDPPARSVGVGEALLDGLLAVARERGLGPFNQWLFPATGQRKTSLRPTGWWPGQSWCTAGSTTGERRATGTVRCSGGPGRRSPAASSTGHRPWTGPVVSPRRTCGGGRSHGGRGG